MTRHLHLLADQGLSGDMVVGGLVDAGADPAVVARAVASLDLPDVSVACESVSVDGVAAADFRVAIGPESPRLATVDVVTDVLELADLPGDVGDRAAAAFVRLARVEADVHGTSVDEVHLHELGGVDTIVDVVAAIVALDDLGIETATVSPIALGRGTVTTDHGRLSVPAPAVAALLRGFDVTAGDGEGELTTPTGALLVAEFATSGPLPKVQLVAQGRGASDGRGGRRSVLTVLVGEAAEASDGAAGPGTGDLRHEEVVLLEATIDDLSPELLPASLQSLRNHPAVRDVWCTPQAMKKGRVGTTVHVLVGDPVAIHEVAGLLITHTTTLGVRVLPHSRLVADRDVEVVQVGGHHVRLKVARLGGRVLRALPEHDDVVSVAERTGRPVADVYLDAQRRAGHLA